MYTFLEVLLFEKMTLFHVFEYMIVIFYVALGIRISVL
jgi:hypothetical protein